MVNCRGDCEFRAKSIPQRLGKFEQIGQVIFREWVACSFASRELPVQIDAIRACALAELFEIVCELFTTLIGCYGCREMPDPSVFS